MGQNFVKFLSHTLVIHKPLWIYFYLQTCRNMYLMDTFPTKSVKEDVTLNGIDYVMWLNKFGFFGKLKIQYYWNNKHVNNMNGLFL